MLVSILVSSQLQREILHFPDLRILELLLPLDFQEVLSVALVGFVGHAEELGEGRADGRQLDLELALQNVLDVEPLAPRRAGGEVELGGGEHGVGDQVVVLGFDDVGRLLLALGAS